MINIYLIGGGGHCKQVIDIFETYDNYKIRGIFDDFKLKDTFFYGYKIIDKIDKISYYISQDNDYLFCCIGDNEIRTNIFNKLLNLNFLNCVSKKSNISKSVKILGKNNYIGDNTNILSDTIIGSNNIINTCANIAHDVHIGNNNHLCPSSVYAGNVIIGDNNLIGTNSTINPKIIIGNNNIIGSGTVCIKNIDDFKVIVGNPGKIIKSII